MQIINSVQSINLKSKIDLQQILEHLTDSYKPAKFPGIVLKLKEPKVAFLIFGSGKIICSGAKSLEDGEKAFQILLAELRKYNLFSGPDPEIIVQNLVAMDKFDFNLDIEKMFYLDNVIYEPEMFPGAIFKIEQPEATFLLFANGYFICSGCRSKAEIKRAIKKLEEFIWKKKLWFEA